MEDVEDEPDAFALQIAGVMNRQHLGDSRAFLRGLADLLESILPEETTIIRSGLLGGDRRPIKHLALTIGSDGTKTFRYTLDDTGKGPIKAARVQIVRNVALKTEDITVAEWIDAVGRAIAQRAEESKSTRDALSDLLFFTP